LNYFYYCNKNNKKNLDKEDFKMDLDKLLADDTTVKEEVTTSEETVKEKLVEKPVKKKETRGRKKGDVLLNEPGDNTKFMKVNMVLFNMDKVDMKDVEAVQNRINEFFMLYTENDMKPTVAGMAMALGTDRQTLWAIKNNQPANGQGWKYNLPPEVSDAIKKAYFLMENLWEQYMSSGKINPVSGIFLGKNNFGYSDKQEYVLTPNTQSDNDYDADAIRERYIAADQQKRLSDGGEDSDQ
jgi:hypothetical protein